LLALIACHAIFNKNYSLSLIICGLIGVLFFPEGAAISVNPGSVLALQFTPLNDLRVMYLLSGIFLVVNLFTLSRLAYEDMPNLVFYAISGLMALISPSSLPIFILMGVIMILTSFSDLKPLSLNVQLGGIIVLTAIIHLFLFVNPFGFKLNPSVRGQMGQALAPILEGYVDEKNILNHEIGEIAWKGLVNIEEKNLKELYNRRIWRLIRLGSGEFEIKSARSFPEVRAPEISSPDQDK
jgi:hypothetical protein